MCYWIDVADFTTGKPSNLVRNFIGSSLAVTAGMQWLQKSRFVKRKLKLLLAAAVAVLVLMTDVCDVDRFAYSMRFIPTTRCRLPDKCSSSVNWRFVIDLRCPRSTSSSTSIPPTPFLASLTLAWSERLFKPFYWIAKVLTVCDFYERSFIVVITDHNLTMLFWLCTVFFHHYKLYTRQQYRSLALKLISV